MTQDALRTKWKFVVEFEDEETNEISGTIGQADTREGCEGLLEYEMQYHNSHGRIVLNAEAAEVCAKCEGEGKIAAMNGGLVICDACGGRLGSISNLTTLHPNGAEFLLIRRGDFSGPLSLRRATSDLACTNSTHRGKENGQRLLTDHQSRGWVYDVANQR
jgi:hypothetical protein